MIRKCIVKSVLVFYYYVLHFAAFYVTIALVDFKTEKLGVFNENQKLIKGFYSRKYSKAAAFVLAAVYGVKRPSGAVQHH